MSCNMKPEFDKHSANSLPPSYLRSGSLQDTWTKNMDFAPDVGWRWILCFEVIKIDKNHLQKQYVGVSKNRDTPKWMVYNGKPY